MLNNKYKQITDAAHQLFIEKGFMMTSIQDILDQAGVAKGTFYNYFNSKNECLQAILESVSEEVDRIRREMALGKATDDEEVFIEQLAVRVKLSRKNNLMAVFQTVSFSEDETLKEFMKNQHLTEIKWVSSRLKDIYPSEAEQFAFDHAVMLIGIIHHLMQAWKISSAEDMEVDKIIRYALERVKSMLDSQLKDAEPLLTEEWVGGTTEEGIDSEIVFGKLKKLLERVKDKDSRQGELLRFLIDELEQEIPRYFILESVLISLENSFKGDTLEIEAYKILKLTRKLF